MTVRAEAAPLAMLAERTRPSRLIAWLAAHPVAAVVILALAVHLVVDVSWVLAVRRPFVGTVDETQFLSAAWADGTALRGGHPHALWNAYQSFSWFGPLVPLLSAPLLALHMSPVSAILIELPFLALLLSATGVIARRLGGRTVAVLAVIAVAGAPVVIDETRNYAFALPSAALLTAAIAALMLSTGLRRTRWSVLFGVCVGLTTLSRLMMVAFLAPVVVAAVLVALGREDRSRRLRNLGVSAAVAFAVAAPWYLPHLSGVLQYLTGDGYGAGATNYGTAHRLLTWQFWTAKASLTSRWYLYLPLTLLCLAAAVAGSALLVRRATRRRGSLRDWAGRHRDLLVVAGVLLVEYLMLTSTANEGNDFELPLVPLLMVLVVLVLVRATQRWWRALLVAAVLATTCLNLATKSLPAELNPAVAMPVLGDVPVVDSGGTIDGYLSSTDARWWTPPVRGDRGAWAALPGHVVALLDRFALAHGRQPIIWFGTSDRVVNFAAVEVACEFDDRRSVPWMDQIDPTRAGDSVAGYKEQLVYPDLLVTGDRGPADFRPLPTESLVEQAAQEVGFTHAFDFTLPDGRQDRVWWRDTGAAAPPAGAVCGA